MLICYTNKKLSPTRLISSITYFLSIFIIWNDGCKVKTSTDFNYFNVDTSHLSQFLCFHLWQEKLQITRTKTWSTAVVQVIIVSFCTTWTDDIGAHRSWWWWWWGGGIGVPPGDSRSHLLHVMRRDHVSTPILRRDLKLRLFICPYLPTTTSYKRDKLYNSPFKNGSPSKWTSYNGSMQCPSK